MFWLALLLLFCFYLYESPFFRGLVLAGTCLLSGTLGAFSLLINIPTGLVLLLISAVFYGIMHFTGMFEEESHGI
jgi:hypothetical protein